MRRIAELDGLRGLAAMAIIAYHMFMNRMLWGWAAVDVFFVLSGFLITGIVLENGGSPGFLPAFYARRALRIWPIYYLLSLLMIFCWLDDSRAVPYYLTYTQEIPRFWGGEMPIWIGMKHTWTLALEEQFYLVWPALVLAAGRRWTGSLALVVALGSAVIRTLGLYDRLLPAHCDGFALGGFLWVLLANPDAQRARRQACAWALGAVGLAVPVIIGLASRGRLSDPAFPEVHRWRVTIATLGSFAIVALVASHAGRRLLAPLRWRLLGYLGSISYGLYIFHYPIVMSSKELCAVLGVKPGPILWTTEAALSFVAAVLSWHLIERPILRFKDWVPYHRARTASRPPHGTVLKPSDGVAASAR